MFTDYQRAKARYCVALAHAIANWEIASPEQREGLLGTIWTAKTALVDIARSDASDGLGSHENMLCHAAADALEGLLYGNIDWQDSRYAQLGDGQALLDNMYTDLLADVYHSEGIE